jgi:hypothetical protein
MPLRYDSNVHDYTAHLSMERRYQDALIGRAGPVMVLACFMLHDEDKEIEPAQPQNKRPRNLTKAATGFGAGY